MSERKKEILFLLNGHKEGLSIPKIEQSLGISRTAVNQHLTNLERDGLVAKGETEKTGGRPGYAYLITGKGIDLLPKQYSWFSELMVNALMDKLGSEGLKSFLQDLAQDVGQQLQSRLWNKSPQDQIQEVNAILQELGYESKVGPTAFGELPMISATNCVYHKLAEKHEEICEFDLALLSKLLQLEVEHLECMVKGGASCRFGFSQQDSSPP